MSGANRQNSFPCIVCLFKMWFLTICTSLLNAAGCHLLVTSLAMFGVYECPLKTKFNATGFQKSRPNLFRPKFLKKHFKLLVCRFQKLQDHS